MHKTVKPNKKKADPMKGPPLSLGALIESSGSSLSISEREA